jgi:hypothetical protein
MRKIGGMVSLLLFDFAWMNGERGYAV